MAVRAQYFEEPGGCNIANALCGYDLSNPVSGLQVSVQPDVVYGTGGTGFMDVQYGLEAVAGGCGDGTSDECFADASILKYNVYYPSNYTHYNSCPLYPVIMFHGGSYAECSDLNNPGIGKVCTDLAKRGFVVFSVEYRRGVLPDRTRVPSPIVVDSIYYTSAQQWLALYRAMQDSRGAIRSIIKRQRNASSFSDPYSIDTTKMFIGGISAGSILALHIAYFTTQSKVNNVFAGMQASLGSINQNWYYGDTTVAFPTFKAVFDMWGALTVPPGKATDPGGFFTNKIPVIAFHGELDSTVYPITVPIYFSKDDPDANVNFGSENRCLNSTYTVPGNVSNYDLFSIGSKSIYTMLRTASVPTELYIDCQMEHGLDNDPNNFHSDFGLGSTADEDDVYDYMAGRAATFFVAVVNNIADKLQTTKFVECKNSRTGCTLNGSGELDDNNACPYTAAEADDYTCEDYNNQ